VAAVDTTRVEPGVNLRRRAARGTLINSGFQIGLTGLGALQRIAVAAFLTRAQYGLWGIIFTVLLTLILVKTLGIADKYVQQSEPDQEVAFQKAFTLELALSAASFVLALVVVPLYALLYGHPEILLPGIVLALAMPLSALESPAWIPYRRMEYARNRLLTGVTPVVSFVVTIAAVAAGAGYWGMIWGAVIGSATGAAVCLRSCPYKIRLRLDRATVREYASFSWPLFGFGLTKLAVVQGSLLVANETVGLVGIAAIGLATTIAVFSDSVDSIVSQTLYPAVCAVADRRPLLAEVFVKSNRVALMWAMPFAVGLALFAGDLAQFVLGQRWDYAVPLLIAFGLTCGLGQVAFNWSVFLRAVNNTRPLLVASILELAVFLLVAVPAMFTFGLAGYAAGFVAATTVQVAIRGLYMQRLFHGFAVLRQLARGVAPTVLPAAVILLTRVLAPGERTVARALAELVVFVLGAIVSTLLLERPLVTELAGYLRGRGPQPATATVATEARG
jgi:O-antigen/teichoic acid export membrane protein